VTEGHPDKLADQISDAVLDAVLAGDPTGRVACETLVTTGLCMIAGEITTSEKVNYTEVARRTIEHVGYTHAELGFDSASCAVLTSIGLQSADIAQGVNPGGAGDQGLMFGYACDETAELMPLPIMLAHQLVRRLSDVRRAGILNYLRPDGKSQVTVEYVDGKPLRVDAVVVSTQHSPDVSQKQLEADIREHIVGPIIPGGMADAKTKYHINPTGRFVRGGPTSCGASPSSTSTRSRPGKRARTRT
jgi:S-adenosylmethionine synthetase